MKYKVTINVSGENHVLFTTAKDKETALKYATNRLAKKLNRTAYSLRRLVSYTGNSYAIADVD